MPNCGCDCKVESKPKKCKCRSYFYAAKNPFDVGIAKAMSGGEYLVLLSGNHHGTTDYDRDHLPDLIGIGERPCRHYRTLTTEEFVSLWKDPSNCHDVCMRKTSFRRVHPNGYLNFYTTDGINRSAMVEITDAKIEVANTGESTLCLMVRLASNDDGRLELDGLDPHMFRVNLSVNPVQAPKHHRHGTRGDTRTNIVMASPPVTTIAPVITGSGNVSGPTTTTTANTTQSTTQSNQQVAQQQQQQQQMGAPDKDKDKKKKKKKKGHHKCKHLKGKKKKECEKKHKKHHHGGDNGGGDGSDRGNEQYDAQKKKSLHY